MLNIIIIGLFSNLVDSLGPFTSHPRKRLNWHIFRDAMHVVTCARGYGRGTLSMHRISFFFLKKTCIIKINAHLWTWLIAAVHISGMGVAFHRSSGL